MKKQRKRKHVEGYLDYFKYNLTMTSPSPEGVIGDKVNEQTRSNKDSN